MLQTKRIILGVNQCLLIVQWGGSLLTFKSVFIYLAVLGLGCSLWTLYLWHVESSSLTRGGTQAPLHWNCGVFSHWKSPLLTFSAYFFCAVFFQKLICVVDLFHSQTLCPYEAKGKIMDQAIVSKLSTSLWDDPCNERCLFWKGYSTSSVFTFLKKPTVCCEHVHTQAHTRAKCTLGLMEQKLEMYKHQSCKVTLRLIKDNIWIRAFSTVPNKTLDV